MFSDPRAPNTACTESWDSHKFGWFWPLGITLLWHNPSPTRQRATHTVGAPKKKGRMNKKTERNIQDYIRYFRDQVILIDDHCPKTVAGELHCRILYMALLDAISRTVFSQEPNRDRFVNFVSEFCGWVECNRVSLSHLYKLVGKKLEPQIAPLRDFAIRCITQWIPAEKVTLSRDPDFAEVENLWPRDEVKLLSIDGVWPNWLTHVHLLYTYRNNLIHEFKIPGRHVELWSDDEPYYAYLIEYQDESSSELKRTWELQYTAIFFRRLCETGLTSLEKYLIANEIDPFKSIDWGNYWIRELNL